MSSLGEAALPGPTAARPVRRAGQRLALGLGRTLPGGSSSYVVRAVTADGYAAVVKVVLAADGLDDQARMLPPRRRPRVRPAAAGRPRPGCTPARGPGGAAARERPEDARSSSGSWPTRSRWPGSRGRSTGCPTGADKAGGLPGLISEHWRGWADTAPSAVRDQALRFADLLADAPGESLVVVHGDPHPGNLSPCRDRPGAETGYCFVDPDGFVADRAYDLGVAVRDWSTRCSRRDRPTLASYAQVLAARTGVDAQRIWRVGLRRARLDRAVRARLRRGTGRATLPGLRGGATRLIKTRTSLPAHTLSRLPCPPTLAGCGGGGSGRSVWAGRPHRLLGRPVGAGPHRSPRRPAT